MKPGKQQASLPEPEITTPELGMTFTEMELAAEMGFTLEELNKLKNWRPANERTA